MENGSGLTEQIERRSNRRRQIDKDLINMVLVSLAEIKSDLKFLKLSSQLTDFRLGNIEKNLEDLKR